MRKYLIRAGMLPFDNYSIEEIIKDNLMGSNAGNILFQTAVVKTVMTDEDVQFDTVTFPAGRQFDYTFINETYDAFLIPLANAFRVSFRWELARLTDLIEKLTIPCIVIGVGADGKIGNDVTVAGKDECIREIQRFMKAVLDRSTIVGVRGEITADFLKTIGYREEEHFTIIGCPSMYYHGGSLPDNKRGKFGYDSRIAVCRKNKTPHKLHKFIEKQMQLFPDHYFIPQTLPDYKLAYAAEPYSLATTIKEKTSPLYPNKFDDEIFKANRAPCFLNQKSWMDFLASCDFCFGSRIHGNIAGVISGTPAFVFPADSRVLELVKYHNIPHMLAKDIDDNLDLIQLYNETDFTDIYKGHAERFNHYLSFMHDNGLQTAFDEGKQCTAFDKKLSEIQFSEALDAFITCDETERMRRIVSYYDIFEYEKKSRDSMIIQERQKAALHLNNAEAQRKRIEEMEKKSSKDARLAVKCKRKFKEVFKKH